MYAIVDTGSAVWWVMQPRHISGIRRLLAVVLTAILSCSELSKLSSTPRIDGMGGGLNQHKTLHACWTLRTYVTTQKLDMTQATAHSGKGLVVQQAGC